MFIQTEHTPNPATLKFIPGQVVLDDGTVDYRSKAEAAGSPLAARLFDVDGVTGVVWFRLPVVADRTAWSAPVLAAVIRGAPHAYPEETAAHAR